MEEKSKILHIGFPKTATTTIQNAFLHQLENTELPCKPGKKIDIQKLKSIWGPENSIKNDVIHKIYELNNKNIFLSEEQILGPNRRFSEQVNIAQVFKELFPNAQILISIRKQDDILKSLYCSWHSAAYAALGFSFSCGSKFGVKRPPFEEWIEEILKDPVDTWGGLLFYDQVIDIWQRIFDKSNVFVLPYEAISKDPECVDDLFQKLLNDFHISFSMSVKNKRYRDRKSDTYKSKLLYRIYSLHTSLIKYNNGSLSSDILKVRNETKDQILNHFYKSNAKLNQKIKFSLNNYGYC